MLQGLKTDDKIVGIKQVRRALNASEDLKTIYIAKDADQHLLEDIKENASLKGIQIVEVETMRELGDACEIDVSAAIAALL